MACALFALIGLGFTLSTTNLTAKNSGASLNSNYSGVNGGVTCNTSGCHSGAAVNSGPGSVSISTDIPGSGYVGGNTYSVSVTVSAGGANGAKYGFSASATKEGTATFTGGFANADNSTLVKASGNYIVHNSTVNGNGVNSSHTFTFDWTAPATGTGNVKFWAAGNSANGNNSSSGDQIYNNSLLVNEAPGASITEDIIDAFNLFPNPATETTNIRIPAQMMDGTLRVMDLTGKIVFNKKMIESEFSLNLSEFKNGIYIVELNKAGKVKTLKLVKN